MTRSRDSSASGDPDARPERAAARVKIDAFVKVQGGDREYVLRTRDLSQKGLFLYTKVGHVLPFKVGSTLSLELYDYDSFVSCQVVVVRVVDPGSPEAESYPAGYGCRIVDIDGENGAVLRDMIERAARTGRDLY